MIVKLPMGVTVNTNNMPDNFDNIIRDSFRKFTEGTNKIYQYEDKLYRLLRYVYESFRGRRRSCARYNT